MNPARPPSRPPRVLAIAWGVSDWRGSGEPIGAYELVRNLALLGAHIDVVTAFADVRDPLPPTVRVHAVGPAPSQPLGNTGRNKKAMLRAARRLLRRGRYDVMHVMTQFTSFPILMTPFVISGCYVPPDPASPPMGRLGRLAHTARRRGVWEALMDVVYAVRWERLAGWSLERTLREADVVIVRQRAGLAVHSSRARRLEFVPFGVVPGPPRRPGTKRDESVLFVGALQTYKGVDFLIEAFSRLASAYPASRLRIIGEGEERARLETLARARGVGERVEFVGHVPRSSLRPSYEAARVFALPSLGESFGQVNLEAMSAGTPVVTTRRVTGAPDYLRDGVEGRLVPARDAEALAGAIEPFLRDPAHCDAVGARARASAEGFDWRIVAQRHVDIYASLMATR